MDDIHLSSEDVEAISQEAPLIAQSFRSLSLLNTSITNLHSAYLTINSTSIRYSVLLDNQCQPRSCIDYHLATSLNLTITACSGSIQLGDNSTTQRLGFLSKPLTVTLSFEESTLPPFSFSHQFEVIKDLAQGNSTPFVLGKLQLQAYLAQLPSHLTFTFIKVLLHNGLSSSHDDDHLISFRSLTTDFQDELKDDPIDENLQETFNLNDLNLQDDLADPDLAPVKPHLFTSDEDHKFNSADRQFILNSPDLQRLWKINENLDKAHPITYPDAEVKLTLKPGTDLEKLSRRQYPIPFKAYPYVKSAMATWLEQKRLAPIGTNPGPICNLPLLGVPKVSQGKVIPDKMRICADPRSINNHLYFPDTFEIPHIKTHYQRLAGKTYFGEFDMIECFNQQPLHKDSRFIGVTFDGMQYRWHHAPYGIKHLSSHTQRWVSSLFSDCDFVFPYIDNLFFASDSLEEHLKHACIILERCNKYNIRLKREAFRFCESNLYNLGHIINQDGISIDPDKVTNILHWKRPTNGKEMQSFLGLTGFVRNYVRHYGTLAAPLEAVKYHKNIEWTESLITHFEALKQAISSCPSLAFADFSKPFYIQVDSSNDGCGAVLFQAEEKSTDSIPAITERNIIGICSKGFNQTQRSYSIYKKELFGLLYALRQFHNYIFLSPTVHVLTDHKPLTFAFTQEKLSPAIQQWIDVLLSYNLTITHIPGYSNIPSDALSRSWMNEFANRKWGIPSNIQLVHAQPVDTLSQSLRSLYIDRADSPPTVIPEAERKDYLTRYHERGHFGRDQMMAQLSYDKIEWPGMKRDVMEFLKSCETCARFTKSPPTFKRSGYILANRPFFHIEMDLCLSFPKSYNNMTALLVIVDLFSSFTFALPIEDKKASTVANQLFTLFSVFGWPEKISSDNGTEFTGSVIKELLKLLKIDQRHAVAWNPHVSGAVEKAVGLVSAVIIKLLRGATIFWPLFCPSAMSYVNSRIHSVTKTSPFEIMFNRRFRFPESSISNTSSDSNDQDDLGTLEDWRAFQKKVNEILFPDIFLRIRKEKEFRAKKLDSSRKLTDNTAFPPGSSVFIKDHLQKDKLDSKYVGPFTVVRKDINGNYVLKDNDDIESSRRVPPEQMKAFVPPANLNQDYSSFADSASTHDIQTLDFIMNHRSVDGTFSFEYLVRWKDGDESWEPSSRFLDLQCIRDYWENYLLSLKKSNNYSKGKKHDKFRLIRPLSMADILNEQSSAPFPDATDEFNPASISEGANRQSKDADDRSNINHSLSMATSLIDLGKDEQNSNLANHDNIISNPQPLVDCSNLNHADEARVVRSDLNSNADNQLFIDRQDQLETLATEIIQANNLKHPVKFPPDFDLLQESRISLEKLVFPLSQIKAKIRERLRKQKQ